MINAILERLPIAQHKKYCSTSELLFDLPLFVAENAKF